MGDLLALKGAHSFIQLKKSKFIFFFQLSAVAAGGPLLTLITIVGISIFWSLPQALMSAELSLMMEVNGGNVVWVQRAFGDFLGWVIIEQD